MMRNLQWKIVLGLALAFCAGAATGLFVGAWQAHRTFDERHGRMMSERMAERMQRKLDLTPEQQRLVDPILRRTAQQLQVIRAETGQRVAQTMEEAHREMAVHLSPEQRARLEQMKKRHRKHLQRREQRRRERAAEDRGE